MMQHMLGQPIAKGQPLPPEIDAEFLHSSLGQ
jgi:hypothetical protein